MGGLVAPVRARVSRALPNGVLPDGAVPGIAKVAGAVGVAGDVGVADIVAAFVPFALDEPNRLDVS